MFCRNGYIHDIGFLSDYSYLDFNGKKQYYFDRDKIDYQSICVKNSDGIDLRADCSNILIENITGFTEDDTIALTNLNGKMEKRFKVKNLNDDIYNINIKNIFCSAFCAIIRLLNQDGKKII